jgi:hypothetical protein
MADTFKQWASKQIHRPGDKITPAQKVTAGFIINKYKTWGEVYKAAGIDTPSIPEKDQIKPTGLKSKTVLSELNLSKRSIQLLQDEINREETGTPAYKKLVGEFNALQIKISNLTTQYEDLNAIEKNIDKVDAAKKKTGTLKSQITSLEEAKKRTADLGQDTKSIDSQIVKLKGQLTETRTVIKRTDTTPNYVPPKVDAEGKVITPRKPAGATASGATANDSDGDGIPNSMDAEPNTPKKSPTPTPTPTPRVPGTPKETPLTDTQQREEALNLAAGQDFTLPETIFNNVPSLKAILERYVKEDWTPDKLRKAIRDDVWYRQNSGAIKQRYVQLFNYRDLVKTGQAQGTTQYEQDIVKLERQIADKARAVGSGIASDPAALRKAAENMYITNVGIDDAMTTDFIAAAIRPIGSTIAGQPTFGYSGQALKDYQELQSVARANGFKISDIVPGGQTEQQVLQGIATGRIDANRIAQDARKLAAQGRPQYVRDLLGQGYNLDQVYSPYRQTMANVLELNADEIDLNDPSLGIAINDKGDMNISEFKRALRKDSRWQYTDQAKEEVSSIALKVLRDFGFQG